MINDDTVAMFFTWTTYGTWLPGDERGHVSNKLRPTGGFEDTGGVRREL